MHTTHTRHTQQFLAHGPFISSVRPSAAARLHDSIHSIVFESSFIILLFALGEE
jgi:hypothetical protein